MPFREKLKGSMFNHTHLFKFLGYSNDLFLVNCLIDLCIWKNFFAIIDACEIKKCLLKMIHVSLNIGCICFEL